LTGPLRRLNGKHPIDRFDEPPMEQMLKRLVGDGSAGPLGEEWRKLVSMDGRQHQHRSDAMIEIIGPTPEGIQLVACLQQLLAIQPRRQ
jgi:hypothetical protein